MNCPWRRCALILATGCGSIFAQSVNWTDPPDGKSITVVELDKNEKVLAPREITVQYTASRALDVGDIVVSSSHSTAPEVSEVTGSGSTWVIHMTRQITPGEVLDIDIDGHWITFQHRPGDVDGDGDTDANDRQTLQNAINASSKSSVFDIDGSNSIDADDLSAFDSLQDAFGTLIIWDDFGETSICCCDGNSCAEFTGTGCPSFMTSTTCPCVYQGCY